MTSMHSSAGRPSSPASQPDNPVVTLAGAWGTLSWLTVDGGLTTVPEPPVEDEGAGWAGTGGVVGGGVGTVSSAIVGIFRAIRAREAILLGVSVEGSCGSMWTGRGEWCCRDK